MKKIIAIIITLSILASCENRSNTTNKETNSEQTENTNPDVFGKEIDLADATDSYELPSLMKSNDKIITKLTGTVTDVCQYSGCWLEIDIGNDNTVHVTFKDDAFVVPKELAGKRVIIEGTAYKEVIPVEMLKKMAQDEGYPQSEIDTIVSPKAEYSFETIGVVIIE